MPMELKDDSERVWVVPETWYYLMMPGREREVVYASRVPCVGEIVLWGSDRYRVAEVASEARLGHLSSGCRQVAHWWVTVVPA